MRLIFTIIISALTLVACESAEPTILGVSAERVAFLRDRYEHFVALSFDDGPNLSTTMHILDVMERNDARGSFFIIGSNLTDESAAAVRRAVEMGCDVENHSLTHPYMSRLTAEEQRTEAEQTTALIEKYASRRPLLFRPPYLDADATTHSVVPQIFIGGVGPADWDANVLLNERIEGLVEAATDGAILLMHDFAGNDLTAEALEVVLPRLAAKGYGFVTVAELFAVKGITPRKGIRYDRVPQE